jgi:hypothetical protein
VSGEIVTPAGFVAANAGLANLVTGNTLENTLPLRMRPDSSPAWAARPVGRAEADRPAAAQGAGRAGHGVRQIAQCGRFVIVANHASFIDTWCKRPGD